MQDKSNKLEEILLKVGTKLDSLSENEKLEKYRNLQNNLFEFANFLEAKITLLYLKKDSRFECDTAMIIKKCIELGKKFALPVFDIEKADVNKIVRIDDVANKDRLAIGIRPQVFSNNSFKEIKIDDIDLAIIPGFVFDMKGNRAGYYDGVYSNLISKLPITTRKVSIAFEEQLVKILPTKSGKQKIDIIVTDKRIIYKI